MGLTLRSTNSNYCNIYFSDATSGTATYEGYISYNHATDTLEFATVHTERLRIDSSGRILIGTTTAGHSDLDDLTISTSGNTGITIRSGTSSLGVIGFADGTSGNAQYRGVIQYSHSGDFMQFNAADTETFRITGNTAIWGRVASIGGGNPGCRIQSPIDGSSRWAANTTGEAIHIQFLNNNAGNIRGAITTNGTSTVYSTSSDYRLKENQTAITDGITRLKLLKPYRFNWKEDTSKIVDGFFAHEAAEVCPDAVVGTKDAVATQDHLDKGIADTIGEPVYQNMDHAKLVPLLTAALKEAIAKIETLETEVAALKSN